MRFGHWKRQGRGVHPLVGGHDEREQTLHRLLAELDGFEIDGETRVLLDTARGRVRKTLRAQREILTALARLLNDHEGVTRDGLTTLLGSQTEFPVTGRSW